MRDVDTMRDQAVRVALCIPARVVARMARVNRTTLMRYELEPRAVTDERRRDRCAQVYRELRVILARFPLSDEASP